jgi:hypothetical protein
LFRVSAVQPAAEKDRFCVGGKRIEHRAAPFLSNTLSLLHSVFAPGENRNQQPKSPFDRFALLRRSEEGVSGPGSRNSRNLRYRRSACPLPMCEEASARRAGSDRRFCAVRARNVGIRAVSAGVQRAGEKESL